MDDQSLRTIERRYRTLAQTSAQVLWIAAPDGGVIEISDQWTAMTGHPKAAAFDLAFTDLIPDEDKAGFLPDWGEKVAQGAAFEADFRLRHADGRYLHVRSRSVPVLDEAGRVYERIGILTDITDRLEADAARRRTEELFFKAFNSSPVAQSVLVVAPGHAERLHVNDEYCALTGYSREELVGTTTRDLVIWDSADVSDKARSAFLAGGQVAPVHGRLRRKNGEIRFVEMRTESIAVGGQARALATLVDLTPRIEAEASLAESEERFRRLSESAFEGIAITENGLIIDGNARLGEMFGYDVAELRGQPARMLLAPDSLQHVRSLVAMQFDAPYEVVGQRRDGTQFDMELRNRLLPHGGRTVRVTAVHDITERKRAERALHESEERFHRLSDAAWEGIVLVDEGVVMDANPQMAAIFGYEPQELIGKPIAEMLPPSGLAAVQRRQREQSLEPYEHEGVRKDGSIVALEARGRSVPYKGRMIRMTAIRDISERRRAQESRRALVAGTAGVAGVDFFRSLTRHLAEAFQMKSAIVAELVPPDGTMLRALNVWSRDEYLPPFEYAVAGTPSEQAILHGLFHVRDGLSGRFADDVILRDLDVVSYLGMPLFDTDRKVLGVLAVLHDAPFEVTEYLRSHLTIFAARAGVELERIRAEAQVLKLNAELEQRVIDRTAELQAANHELEAFSYSVSHDLRAPLRHVSGFVSLLQRETDTALSGTPREYLHEIAESAARMHTLIDDLLEFSRVGRASLHKTEVDLAALAREVADEASRDADGRRIAWVIGVLPRVRCDQNLMRQVLANLVANAVKYTRPRDEAVIEIGTLPAERDGDAVCFVRDNGVGFDMKYARKLFGVFQRLHSAAAFEGTGIGLANVQRIVQRHGGRVWATGAVNAGATFFFSLPGHQGTAEEAGAHD